MIVTNFQRAVGQPLCALLTLGTSLLSVACTCEDIPDGTTATVQEPIERMANPKVAPLPNGCLPQPAGAAPATQKLPNGGTVRVAAYAHDLTDKSGVAWNQSYPSPCLDDRPPRKGYPNAAWHGNYTVEGDNLCLTIDALYPHYPPKNRLQIGYTVQLSGLTFEDGSTKKNIVLYEFSRLPKEVEAKKCVTLKRKEEAATAGSASGGPASSASAAAVSTGAKGPGSKDTAPKGTAPKGAEAQDPKAKGTPASRPTVSAPAASPR